MVKRLLVFALLVFCVAEGSGWGFFAHRMINRLAVFALPEELLGFYKSNIEYLTEHAVDPDKRRYSAKDEAARHYIDLDHFESAVPVDTMPRRWRDAALKFTEDTLAAYGIVPWHINTMMYRLTQAFRDKDVDAILRNSAEIGHYISDAHVPLHATENYNGQLSNQVGIHGFWESRLPELFHTDYDFFVGRAFYINNILDMAWQASASSFAAKDSVLLFESLLNSKFPSDKKYILEQKGQTQVKVYSREYAEAYNRMLDGQVERRMRQSMLMVASAWYTAWVDAGQPDLDALAPGPHPISSEERKVMISEEHKLMQERMIGRGE